jgi:ABC-type dipeptide/oligopeptide/nickel transport system permease component
LIGGAAIVEVVFNWNGAGQWGLTAMLNLDVPAIQAFVLFVSAATFVVYLALDLLAISLDPRISLEAVK